MEEQKYVVSETQVKVLQDIGVVNSLSTLANDILDEQTKNEVLIFLYRVRDDLMDNNTPPPTLEEYLNED